MNEPDERAEQRVEADLAEVLSALAQGDLAGGRLCPDSSAARAGVEAMARLAELIRPVRDELRRLERAARRLPESRRVARRGDRALEVATARLTELEVLAKRLVEVGTEASVTSLNLSVTLRRQSEPDPEQLAAFADEVRRLTERTNAVTARLPVVVGELRSALEEGRSAPGGDAPLEELSEDLAVLIELFDRRLKLPPPGDGSERIAEAGRRLAREVRQLREQGQELPPELEGAVAELAAAVGEAGGD